MNITFCLFKNLFICGNRGSTKGISCILSNKFSSTTAALGKNSNIPFSDSGEARLILPSLNDRIEFMDILKGSLSSLESCEKSFSYKLEYCLYLHTNDGNKELM